MSAQSTAGRQDMKRGRPNNVIAVGPTTSPLLHYSRLILMFAACVKLMFDALLGQPSNPVLVFGFALLTIALASRR